MSVRKGIAAFALAAACLRFEPEIVEISGRLELRSFPGPPNYESVADGDDEERAFILVLAEAVCVDARPGSGLNEWPLSGIREVHAYSSKVELAKLVGKRVSLSGTLFTGHTGHHHAPVVLEVTSARSEHER